MADALNFGCGSEHAQAVDRPMRKPATAVDEAYEPEIAVDLIGVQFARECNARAVGADDDGPNVAIAPRALTLEREQPGLESDPSTAEQYQQRRDRRPGEHRQGGVSEL